MDIRFYQKMQPYKDKYGFYHPSKVDPVTLNPPTQNGIAYSSLFARINNGGAFMWDLRSSLPSCSEPKAPGILHRSPESKQQEAWDDYFSLLCCYQGFMNIHTVDKVIEQGSKTHIFWYDGVIPIPLKYYFNNEQYVVDGATKFHHPDGRFNQQAWLGKYLFVVAQFKVSAGKKLNWIEKLGWSIGLVLSVHKPLKTPEGKYQNQGSYRMGWLQKSAYKYWQLPQKFLLGTLAVKYFDWNLKRRGLKIQDTQHEYFEAGHPVLEIDWE
jgi:hypothetical protein